MNKKERKESLKLTRQDAESLNPFWMMRRFTKDMERLFWGLPGGHLSTPLISETLPLRKPSESEWLPTIEVLENNGQFTVRADLPGLTIDDVKVEVTEEMLMISGERKEEKEEKDEGFYRSERRYGTFYRQLRLPTGALPEKAEARFANGVLEVTMPALKEESATRKLEIKGPTEEKAAKAAA